MMSLIDDYSIDLTVTSPPYNGLRTYEGYEFDFEPLAKELYRVTKEGGVIVWIVGDATIDGSETGTSFRQALFFMDIGFNLHDTMIYMKGGQGAVGSNLAYWQNFEYMFVFSKEKIGTFNPLNDRKNAEHRQEYVWGTKRKRDGATPGKRRVIQKKYGKHFNIWGGYFYRRGNTHPAVFPDALANDHILSWSNEGDLVLDPMCGSGTTCKTAKLNNRDYIGIDISSKYCEEVRNLLMAIPLTLDKIL